MEHNLKPTYFREYNCSMQIRSQTTNILILTQTEFVQSIKHIAQDLKLALGHSYCLTDAIFKSKLADTPYYPAFSS
jgi:hypothetical protein